MGYGFELHCHRKKSFRECGHFCASSCRQTSPSASRAACRSEPRTTRAGRASCQRLGCADWPKQFGGTGWSPVQLHIFDEESAAAGAPRSIPFGLKSGRRDHGFRQSEQQQRWLPRIVSGEDWWCQGYSEPGAGSDLASLKTRAERQGDHYIVNGQKTWNTLGQYADWIFCLVRTDPNAPKQQQGISFLLIDMKTPGITVRPIITMDGAHEVNEVWLENVKVPVENRIGEENKGWTYAKFLLGHERTNIAGVGASKRELQRLKDIARQEIKNGRPLIEDPLFAARIAQVEIDLMALEITNLRVLSAEAAEARAGAGSFDPQDQGHEDAAGAERADDVRGRPVRPALRARLARGRRSAQRRRSGLRGAAGRDVLQLSQGHDLRRLERDSAQHHFADDSRAYKVRSWISISPKNSSCSPTPCSASCASIIRSRRAARF